MSDIPSDIMNTSLHIVEGYMGVNIPGALRNAYISCISEAIYEERKRCARIAETIDVEVKTMAGCSRQNEMTKSTISKAILSGETKD